MRHDPPRGDLNAPGIQCIGDAGKSVDAGRTDGLDDRQDVRGEAISFRGLSGATERSSPVSVRRIAQSRALRLALRQRSSRALCISAAALSLPAPHRGAA